MFDLKARLHHGLLTSSLALGLTTVALLGYPPLSYAGALMLAYMGIPTAQSAFASVQEGQPVNRELVETLALAALLAQGQILVGSAAFSLYYVGSYLYWQRKQQQRRLAQVVRVQQGEQLVDCTVADVTPGMHLLFSSGDLVPLSGVVLTGQALVNQHAFTAQASAIILQTGDRVIAGSLILVGELRVLATQAGAG